MNVYVKVQNNIKQKNEGPKASLTISQASTSSALSTCHEYKREHPLKPTPKRTIIGNPDNSILPAIHPKIIEMNCFIQYK